jgi:hypothetical protein
MHLSALLPEGTKIPPGTQSASATRLFNAYVYCNGFVITGRKPARFGRATGPFSSSYIHNVVKSGQEVLENLDRIMWE